MKKHNLRAVLFNIVLYFSPFCNVLFIEILLLIYIKPSTVLWPFHKLQGLIFNPKTLNPMKHVISCEYRKKKKVCHINKQN